MAAITPINIGLQARDWETLIGIIFNNGDVEIQQVLFQLQSYYAAQATKPAGNAVIAVATTEDVVLKIAGFLYGNTVRNVTQDVGGSCFNRVMAALRALNNAADNYINTQFAQFDTDNNTVQANIRKQGRKYIMILSYDNA